MSRVCLFFCLQTPLISPLSSRSKASIARLVQVEPEAKEPVPRRPNRRPSSQVGRGNSENLGWLAFFWGF